MKTNRVVVFLGILFFLANSSWGADAWFTTLKEKAENLLNDIAPTPSVDLSIASSRDSDGLSWTEQSKNCAYVSPSTYNDFFYFGALSTQRRDFGFMCLKTDYDSYKEQLKKNEHAQFQKGIVCVQPHIGVKDQDVFLNPFLRDNVLRIVNPKTSFVLFTPESFRSLGCLSVVLTDVKLSKQTNISNLTLYLSVLKRQFKEKFLNVALSSTMSFDFVTEELAETKNILGMRFEYEKKSKGNYYIGPNTFVEIQIADALKHLINLSRATVPDELLDQFEGIDRNRDHFPSGFSKLIKSIEIQKPRAPSPVGQNLSSGSQGTPTTQESCCIS